MIENTDHYLRINEIKNYLYCPRISYYKLCMDIDIETDLSRAGIAEEAHTKHKMKRRKQALHSVHEGERHYDVALAHHEYHFLGRIDEMVVTEKGVYLVDYKDTDKDYGYWKLQMHAYRLATEAMGQTVLGCYVYLIPQKKYKEVKTIHADTEKMLQLCCELETMIVQERFPAPATVVAKCHSCQYARLCNDVL